MGAWKYLGNPCVSASRFLGVPPLGSPWNLSFPPDFPGPPGGPAEGEGWPLGCGLGAKEDFREALAMTRSGFIANLQGVKRTWILSANIQPAYHVSGLHWRWMEDTNLSQVLFFFQVLGIEANKRE